LNLHHYMAIIRKSRIIGELRVKTGDLLRAKNPFPEKCA